MTYNRNAFHANIGGIYLPSIGGYGAASINFEHVLNNNLPKNNIVAFIKLGGGGFASWDRTGIYSTVQLGILTGYNKSAHHLEISGGLGRGFGGNQT